jgi:hypothetical protein
MPSPDSAAQHNECLTRPHSRRQHVDMSDMRLLVQSKAELLGSPTPQREVRRSCSCHNACATLENLPCPVLANATLSNGETRVRPDHRLRDS